MPRNLTEPEIHEWAALHSLGSLGQHEARAMRSLLSAGEGALEHSVRDFDRVVAAIGLAVPEVEPPPSLREKLLASTGETEASEKTGTKPFSIVRASEEGWKRIAELVFMKELFVNSARGTTTCLLRILPGGSVPAHRHSTIEEIFVIEGDCQINAELLGPGDYRCAQPGTADRSLTSERGTTVLLSGSCSLELL